MRCSKLFFGVRPPIVAQKLRGGTTAAPCLIHHPTALSGSPRGTRQYSVTPVAQRKWFRGLFRWSRKKGPSGDNDAPVAPKLSLFRQDHIPEDLRLPTPADPFARTGAGLLDAGISVLGGAALGGAVQLVTNDANLAWSALQGGSLLLWVLRDSLGDGRNRSIGKRVCGVEITNWDGSLASPAHAALRNWYFFAAPLAFIHPIAEMVWTVMLVFDVSSLFFTQDARKLGDYMFGTRVVNEREGRLARIQDRADAQEIAQLRKEIESLSGSLPRGLESSQVEAHAREMATTPLTGDETARASGSSSHAPPLSDTKR